MSSLPSVVRVELLRFAVENIPPPQHVTSYPDNVPPPSDPRCFQGIECAPGPFSECPPSDSKSLPSRTSNGTGPKQAPPSPRSMKQLAGSSGEGSSGTNKAPKSESSLSREDDKQISVPPKRRDLCSHFTNVCMLYYSRHCSSQLRWWTIRMGS